MYIRSSGTCWICWALSHDGMMYWLAFPSHSFASPMGQSTAPSASSVATVPGMPLCPWTLWLQLATCLYFFSSKRI